jgi:hypothetical protein
VTLQNTLLASSVVGDTSSPDCYGPITSLGYNLISDPSGCAIALQPTDLAGDPLNGPLDPGLGPLTDDGTPGNGHFPLLPTSPAIGAGNGAACPKRDQLGEKRNQPCDIGAIEFQETAVSSR